MDPIAVSPTAMGQEEPPSEPKYSHKGPRSSSAFRLRCFFYFLFFIIITIIILFAIMASKYESSLPDIDIIEFDTVKFEVGPESTLQTKFVLSMRIDNSNTQFRITYEKGSSIEMSYNNTAISAGTLPESRQELGTVTVFKVVMEGENKYEGDLKVVMEGKNSDPVPLVVQVEMPMAVEMEGFVSTQIKLSTDCVLMVDHLDPQQQTNNLTSHSCNVPNIHV